MNHRTENKTTDNNANSNRSAGLSDAEKREYVHEVIAHLESQNKHTKFYVSFGVAIIVFITTNVALTNSSIKLTGAERVLAVTSLLAIAVSTLLFVVWSTCLHWLRIKAINALVTLDINELQRVHYPGNEYYKRWGWIEVLAYVAGFVGTLGFVILVLLRL